MQVSERVRCEGFPCAGVVTAKYSVPAIDVEPAAVRALLVCEAPPPQAGDGFYAAGDPFYLRTTLQAFEQAGVSLTSVQGLLDLGIYITTAIKCGKVGYAVPTKAIQTCSEMVLEQELALFPGLQAVLLMGDVAIKAMNYLVKRKTGKRLIPSGPTYKVRKSQYFYQSVRVFPSYLQTGKSFLIEKSKQKMIAEDIRAALNLLG